MPDLTTDRRWTLDQGARNLSRGSSVAFCGKSRSRVPANARQDAPPHASSYGFPVREVMRRKMMSLGARILGRVEVRNG